MNKTSSTFAFVTVLLLCVFSPRPSDCQNFLDPERIATIEELISNNTFYPPLNDSGGLRPLVFGLIMSFGGNIDSSGAVPGVRVALDRINSNSSLLPGYSLHYALSDSQCHRPQAIRALFKQVPYSEPKRIALIGAGCSVASESTAEISHVFNMMQISCVSSTPALSNRERFPNYFQLLPSNLEFADTYFGVIKEFNWRHVIILLQNENLFTLTLDRLKDLLTEDGITYTTDLFYSSTGLASLDREPFSDPDERIYIIASYEPYARELLCEAYHRNVRYPTHLLLTYQWYSPNWWLVEDQNYTCTGEQRAEVLHMTLSVDIFRESRLDRETLKNTSMNITEEEFFHEIDYHANKPPFNFSSSEYSQYCHDATWALAWSLSRTITLPGLEKELTNFSYVNNEVSKTIITHMNSSFIGLTGNVTFDKNGVRKATRLLVYQYRLDDSGNIYTRETGRIVFENNRYYLQYLPNESATTVWPNELIPYDGLPNETVDTVNIIQAVIGFLVGAAGIAFAIVCLIFNFYFRNKRIIKISRPMLNFLIILGAIIFYLAGIIFVIPTTDESASLALITARSWCLSLGYSFCYGTIIMKMCRVYYIVHNPRPNKNIRDSVLALGVLILVSTDLVILILNIVISKALGQFEVILVPNKDQTRTVSGENRVSTDHVIYIYDPLTNKVFIGLLYSIKVLFQLIAMLLALCTHDIKVKGLDDAKYIIAAVYITTINLLLAAMTTYTLAENLYIYTTTIFIFIFFSTTLILGVVFIPKMIALYKDPQGENVFGKYEAPSFKSPQQYTQKPPQCASSESDTTVAAIEPQKKGDDHGFKNMAAIVTQHGTT